MALKLIITGKKKTSLTEISVSDFDSKSSFKNYLSTVSWGDLEEIKLLNNNSSYLRLKKFENNTALIQIIEGENKWIHKFTYRSINEVINALSIYRKSVKKFQDTFHLATMEEFAAIKNETEGELNFSGSFNEKRLLEEANYESPKEKSKPTFSVIGIIITLVAIYRLVRLFF